ncbi:adenylate cyclase [Morganella morganii]|uniref:anthrax toxin-like adenylyl cyclase domain-containing protein n=1 Tax=Morganella morganii TaxID=582 RepID=UPI00164B5AFE|nr:anthrax toxin-like adenylyl cyclase domain-containing protein [Morganella morganii]MBC4012222.1 adenylate cyclase [Morganella morganii]
MLRINPSFPSPIPVCTQDSACQSVPETEKKLSFLITDRTEILHRSGIAEKHLTPLLAFAEKEKLVISFRPVEHAATGLINAGYPTKNFHIKGKSANLGPMAGFIPVEQHLSKLGNKPGDNAGKISRMNEEIQQCIRGKYAEPGDLVITAQRIRELIEMNLISECSPPLRENMAGKITYTLSVSSGNPAHIARYIARPAGGDLYAIYHADNKSPVQVLYSPDVKQPLTADYDLMIVSHPMENHGVQDTLRIKSISPEEHIRQRAYLLSSGTTRKPFFRSTTAAEGLKTPVSLPAKEILRRASAQDAIRKELQALEHPGYGNSSQRITDLIPEINSALVCKPGCDVVHHGMDAANPYSELDDNFPATFFLPEQIGDLPQVVTAENKDGLKQLLHILHQHGYYILFNPRWDSHFISPRREHFEATRNIFENKKFSTL